MVLLGQRGVVLSNIPIVIPDLLFHGILEETEFFSREGIYAPSRLVVLKLWSMTRSTKNISWELGTNAISWDSPWTSWIRTSLVGEAVCANTWFYIRGTAQKDEVMYQKLYSYWWLLLYFLCNLFFLCCFVSFKKTLCS